MYFPFVLIFVPILMFIEVIHCDRNYLMNEFNAKNGLKGLMNINEWRNKYLESIANDSKQMSEQFKTVVISEADKENNFEWPSLLLTQFLEYKQNGNRANFEKSYLERRNKLLKLIRGEILSSGKYINQIINGLWLILEESTWVLPAHLYLQKDRSGLSDPNEHTIDLFNAETARLVSFIQLVLGSKISKINNGINIRINYELNRRIVEPYLSHNFDWMKGTNNWNPWINTNVLRTVLFTTNDEKQRNDIIVKTIGSVDYFLNSYPNDGGCDEGPHYWSAAGGRLIEIIDLLTSLSNGKMDWSTNNLIHNMGSYIYKLYIGDGKWVNFADAPPNTFVDASKVMLFGEIFKDNTLRQFASYINNHYRSVGAICDGLKIFGGVQSLASLNRKELNSNLLLESWLPNLQVFIIRATEGYKGFFLGAKAGNNGESHNHNDVGSFVLYINIKPGLIDIGPQAYNNETFGPKRYEIWNLQSQWHNCPSINGFDQKDGAQYKANYVSYTKTANGGQFVADISGAYPKEAMVKRWERIFDFNRSSNILTLYESFELTQYIKPSVIHFITILNELSHKEGEIVLKKDDTTLIMKYDKNLFDMTIDKHNVTDYNLSRVWGNNINRINLMTKQKSLKSSFKTVFQMA